ncbi:hypothetical protein [Paenibacillus illinoisensis]|uniref:hypothetical protein n=1 Tax=Paenibacillus illinoisensis TaxID=59845 RepID=UPI00301C2E9C
MKEKLEQGRTYDCVVSGQVWSFTVVDIDEDHEQNIWILWAADEEGQEECHSVDSLLKKVTEHKNNISAGVIYPRGDSEEAQVMALSELLAEPRYKFAQMEVSRALILTDHFSPKGQSPDKEYLEFVFDPDTSMLKITSPDSEATIPSWLIEHFKISAITQVHSKAQGKKATFLLKLE